MGSEDIQELMADKKEGNLDTVLHQHNMLLHQLRWQTEQVINVTKQLQQQYNSAFDPNNPDSVISRLADVEMHWQVVDAKIGNKKSVSTHFTPERIAMSLVLSISLITNAFLANKAPEPVRDLIEKGETINSSQVHISRDKNVLRRSS